MSWFAVAGMAVAAVGTAVQYQAGSKAGKAAKKQAKLEAAMEKKLTTERIRQVNLEERQQFGETVAGYVGSGVQVGSATLDGTAIELPGSQRADRQDIVYPRDFEGFGDKAKLLPYGDMKVAPGTQRTPTNARGLSSPLIILAEMAKEREYERKILRETSAAKVQQALSGGKSTADYYKYTGMANVASGISGLLTSIAVAKKG